MFHYGLIRKRQAMDRTGAAHQERGRGLQLDEGGPSHDYIPLPLSSRSSKKPFYIGLRLGNAAPSSQVRKASSPTCVEVKFRDWGFQVYSSGRRVCCRERQRFRGLYNLLQSPYSVATCRKEAITTFHVHRVTVSSV